MQKLDTITSKVADSINTIEASVLDINKAVKEIELIAQQNEYNIDVLAEEVSMFKVIRT